MQMVLLCKQADTKSVIGSIIFVSLTAASSIVIASGMAYSVRANMSKMHKRLLLIASASIGVSTGIAYTITGKPLLLQVSWRL